MRSLSWILVVGICSPIAWAKQPAAQKSVVVASPPPARDKNEPPVEIVDLSLDKPDGVKLTMDVCVETAIRAATSVLRAENDLDASGAALVQGYVQFLPNLVATGNAMDNKGTQYYTQSVPTVVQNKTTSSTYTVTTTLNIFNGLSDLAHLKSASLHKEASQLSLLRAKQAIALDISQSYLNVILDNNLVDFARKNLQQSQARERLLEEQTRVGVTSYADLFRQRAQTSSDVSLLLNTENKRRTDQVLLLQKLRLDVTKNYHFADYQFSAGHPNERYMNEDKLIKLGLDNRADLKARNDTADAAHWDIKSNFSGYLPRLDLQAGMVGGGAILDDNIVNAQYVVPASQTPLFSQLGSQIEYSIGIVVTWNIFDRLVTYSNVAQARVKADDADIDAQDFRNQVLADVRLAFSNYKTSIQQLRASKEGLEAAQKAYAVIAGRYEVGSANFIDLITAQATLLQSESTRAQAQIDFVLQGKAVEFAIGELAVK